ncbi:MAG: hypothetical protein LQ352_002084 [Teloschistes flavicans]|nr:MAG: hypothetical protein LQ352_002084 [Teloschistes flavicans]
MDRPAKRRRLLWRGDDGLEKEEIGVAEHPTIQLSPAEKEHLLDHQLPLHAAALKLPHFPVPFTRQDPLLSSEKKSPKPQRLHPRKLNLHRDAGSAADPDVQSVTTAVASFVNVVLESGGTSVGNVLVPAASSVFDLGGYGPITINKNPASSPTPSSNPHRHSHAPQQTPQPASSAAGSQPTPSQQNPMNIQFLVFSDHKLYADIFQYFIISDEYEPTSIADCAKCRVYNNKRQFQYLASYLVPDDIRFHQRHNVPRHHHSDRYFKFDCIAFVLYAFEFPQSNLNCDILNASGHNQGTGTVGVGGPASTAGGPPASSSTGAAGSGGGSSPSTPALVGGVVGGVAGLALILAFILFYLRRRHRKINQRNISPPNLQGISTGIGPGGGSMTQRSSAAIPLAGAGFFRRLRPDSGATATTTETVPSERGFQNLGGRKLPSVLSSRGDGYGDIPFGSAGSPVTPGPSSSRGAAPPSIPIVTAAPGAPGHASPESLSGSSFYRDSQGFYGGPGQGQAGPEPPSNSSSMVVGPASPPQSPIHPPTGALQPPEGVAVMRPGPARTPVTTQGGLSPMRGPHTRGTPPPPQIPGTIQERPRDGLGRSHPSMDGSRGSRFAENI